jgi:Xaa-Pro aminopeptidase
MSLLVKKTFWKIQKKVNQFVNELRLIKSSQELECLKKSANIASAAFFQITKEILREGLTEKEIFEEIKSLLRRLGSEGEPFDFIVGSGPNGAHPHAIPSKRMIKTGEPVVLDFGATYQGFCSDITRTVCLGEVPEKLKEIYKIVLEAQRSTLEAIRPGKTCAEIDQVAREVVARAGYQEAFLHNTGHGIGFEVHELPTIKPGSQEIIREGMCFTVEPGIYAAGWGGVRVEDMVYVTASGCEVLTMASKELRI